MNETTRQPNIAPSLLAFLEAPETESQSQATRTGRAISKGSNLAVIFRHSGWVHSRRLIGESLDRTKQSFARQKEFEHCGSHAYVLRSVDDPNKYRIAGSACRDRFCLPCATERSCVIAGNVIELVQGKGIRFLTLTVKTGSEPLRESLDKLYRSFQALRRRSIWKNRVDGGVAFLELLWSHSGQRWHPHFHCLLEGRWIDRKVLQRVWHEITGDSYVVDIRRPKNDTAIARYVTKYASKPFNNSYVAEPTLLDEAIIALKGRKLAVTYGCWRGKLLTATPQEGAWEHVAPLESVLGRAAHGCLECKDILASLTDRDLTSLFARAPPEERIALIVTSKEVQLDWHGVWQADSSFAVAGTEWRK